jgi:hypothetical protein
VPPAKFSIRRRNVWPDVKAAYDHFAAKDLFAAWAPGVLADYMDSGLKPHPDGVQLRFTRENETAVYATLPHHLPKLLSKGSPVPIGLSAATIPGKPASPAISIRRRWWAAFPHPAGRPPVPDGERRAAAQATKEMIADLLGGQSGKKFLKKL